MEALAALEQQAREAVAAAADLKALDEIRVRYLGKKGLLTEQLKQLGALPADQRPRAGQAINIAKKQVQEAIETRKADLQQAALQAQLAAECVDVTLPVRTSPAERGSTPPRPSTTWVTTRRPTRSSTGRCPMSVASG